MDITQIAEELKVDEGFRSTPYRCTMGRLTIGYGRNLDDKGITKTEAEELLYNDIERCYFDLLSLFSNFDKMPDKIQHVLINMRYQLGASGFRTFKDMIAAAQSEDWNQMKKEMRNSLWYKQTPERAEKLIKQVNKEFKK